MEVEHIFQKNTLNWCLCCAEGPVSRGFPNSSLLCSSSIVEYHGRHNHFVKGSQRVHNQDLSAWTKKVKAKRSLSATSNTDPRTSGSCLWGPELLMKLFVLFCFVFSLQKFMYCNEIYLYFEIYQKKFNNILFWKISLPCVHCRAVGAPNSIITCHHGNTRHPIKIHLREQRRMGSQAAPETSSRDVAETLPLLTQRTDLPGFEKATTDCACSPGKACP